jgi:3D-(3,5/4)-trihydroxycyclohexane-1,2-dione acylhydrolase (decyclizing)
VLLVNGGYQSIHALQRSVLGAGFGTEFRAPVDYEGNARSLGCEAWTATTPDELATALREAREQPRPGVIVCHVEPHRMLLGSGAWWDLGVPETSERALAHRAGAAKQRFHG